MLNLANETELETLSPSPNQAKGNGDKVIILKGAAFGVKEEGEPITHRLNLEISRPSLTMVIGRIGSGKSTLLKGLIGELPTMAGSIQSTFKELAYCEQQPWLANGSIQNNILGYSTLETKWYETVIRSCALDKDFATLPHGDQSLVGSKGITLSGGQKARVVRLISK